MGLRQVRLPALCVLVALAGGGCGVAVAMGSSPPPVAAGESLVAVGTDAPATAASDQACDAPSGPVDPAPDLVRVVATNGMTGYCRDKDTLGPCPEDADENTKACLRGYSIPVYSEDGMTQIGEFIVGGPGSEAVFGQAGGARVTMTARKDGTIVTTTTGADGRVTARTLEALDGAVTTLE